MLKENIVRIYENSFRENWDSPCISEYSTKRNLNYCDFAKQIAVLHNFYRESGITAGDKIAVLGKNNINWVVVFIGTITYGAVIVPILHEFNPQDAQHIINHSESKLLFVENAIWDHLELASMPLVRMAVSLTDNSILESKDGDNIETIYNNNEEHFAKRFPKGFTANDLVFPEISNDSLCELNYTSGTTGFSKGVMLTINNLTGNVVFGMRSNLHFKGSRCLSFLPMAHAYGCAFDLLVPLAVGTHITVLGKIPSPKIIMAAMATVKPDLVICVPLVLEKIYRKMIQPLISKKYMRWSMQIPFLNSKIFTTIRDKLINAFGGNFSQVIVGGAPLNAEVEDFLRKIGFPITVGYGMTECAPLISYTYWSDFVPHSAGQVLEGLMQVRIDSADPQNIPGEICVHGEHVMKGYYKNEEATAKVLEPDGWLHTGDMGVVSEDGTITIRGRCKTMILSANGQNIYPEEIEAKLNNMPFVGESLVIERDGKLVALVYPDYETMDAVGMTLAQLPENLEQVRNDLNKIVAPYEKITQLIIQQDGFEKTPKQSIKRYLYS